jgi:hypothetical protein
VEEAEEEDELVVGARLAVGEVETGRRDRVPVRLAVEPGVQAPAAGENEFDELETGEAHESEG